MKDIIKKTADEKRLVREMIAMYCRKNHGSRRGALCSECRELAAYAEERSDSCPLRAVKTYCSNCRVHCYKPEMRQKIKKVMAFSAPRLLFTHPFKALDYVVKVKLEKKNLAEKS
ncbi:MAG: nitrous oxide-stimulated promoter family protein [Bacillota bacterium]|jgi:hypothetical protein